MLNKNESELWDKKYKTSRVYESAEDVFHFSKNNPTILAIKPYIKDGMSILEVGSGTGELISYIQHLYPNCKTYGVDFSNESVNRSKNIASKFGLRTSFIQGDIKSMSFPNESFDIVFGDQVIGHIDDLYVALKEIYRVTKPNGIVAFSIANSLRPDGWYFNKTFSSSHQGYKQKGMFPWTLTNLLCRTGFERINFYGDMLFLFRNISLVKSFFKKRIEKSTDTSKDIKESSSNKSFLKRAYYFLDKIFLSWSKVTIGIVAKKVI